MCVGQGYGLVDVSWLRGGGNHERPPPDRSTVTTMITPDDITTITSTLTIPNVLRKNMIEFTDVDTVTVKVKQTVTLLD